ncbi:MAG TPA: hypothetical protein PKA58_05625 [Polyangium sp.]|jgi:hypothetical protein|nr:hypothetical protein [Polyangium sp.]
MSEHSTFPAIHKFVIPNKNALTLSFSRFTVVLPKGTNLMIDENDENSGDEFEDTQPAIDWDIQRSGRPWTKEEFDSRANRIMGLDFEISRGKLFWSERTRLMVLGMLLENVGIDAAVRLGDPARWKEAVAELSAEPKKP